ncbi:MAG: glutamate 5-kinase [Clostridiaceae bacterium]|jgi:glutamate 5-kinase|nr:glutamate 5-kinase [Clostridiaceae bacterium]
MANDRIEKQGSSPIRGKITKSRRVVIKVGTSTITYENGRFNLINMEHLCRSIANQMNQGREIILVSSGAIGVGVGRLRLAKKPKTIREKQAVAAVGQCELMSMYSRLMAEHNYTVAQILLTRDDIDEKITRQNICNTFEALIEKEIIPIVNENDTVSTREIYHNGTFGDNDTLSAIVAALINADLLIILSDIDGLYTRDPRTSTDARLITTVDRIDRTIVDSAGGEGSLRGTGGMRSKISAARIAVDSGLETVIANGSIPQIIDDILDGQEKGTYFRVPEKDR